MRFSLYGKEVAHYGHMVSWAMRAGRDSPYYSPYYHGRGGIRDTPRMPPGDWRHGRPAVCTAGLGWVGRRSLWWGEEVHLMAVAGAGARQAKRTLMPPYHRAAAVATCKRAAVGGDTSVRGYTNIYLPPAGGR